MTRTVALNANCLVVVADGEKALFLRNAGDAKFPNLRVERLLEAGHNPPTHDQGTDRPGRVAVGAARSAVEGADWHDRAEAAFAADIMAALHEMHRDGQCKEVVLVAAPRTLAVLRQGTSALGEAVVAEIAKDLTKLPVWDIEKHLAAEPADH